MHSAAFRTLTRRHCSSSGLLRSLGTKSSRNHFSSDVAGSSASSTLLNSAESSSTAKAIRQISMAEPLPSTLQGETKKRETIKRPDSDSSVQMTTMPSGLRVASMPFPGELATVGAIMNSGSRYEAAFPPGISHFISKLAYGACGKFESREEIMNKLGECMGIVDVQDQRDTCIYAASIHQSGLDLCMEIFGETIFNPALTEEEMEGAKIASAFELEDISLQPMQDQLLIEAYHSAAFSCNTVGLPRYSDEQSLESMDKTFDVGAVRSYLDIYHVHPEMVLAGVGVDHDELLKMAEKYFEPAWMGRLAAQEGKRKSLRDCSMAQYTGGRVEIKKDLSQIYNLQNMEELDHLAIFLESVSHQDPDFIPFCVMRCLLGGGGSFSSGGPGKGMYSRLYTNVLNKGWIYNATAECHAYADSGIFGITAGCPPMYLGELAKIICQEIVKLTSRIGDEEFNRAKSMLKSLLLMNLEYRAVVLEDVARQVLFQDTHHKPVTYIDLIDKVTKEDIYRVAEKMLQSKVSVAAVGQLNQLPSQRDFESLLSR